MNNQIDVNTQPLAVRSGGENSSESMSQFTRNVAEDLQNLAKQGNTTSTEVVTTAAVINDEINHLRTSVSALEKAQDFREREATTLVKTLDFFSRKNVTYAEGADESNKLTVDTRFGQVYLPSNSTTPRFFLEDPKTGKITANPNLSVIVTGGEPVIPGFSPSIKEGVVKNAFNGFNGSYWKRSISYPLEASVESVSVTVTVKVPPTSSTDLEIAKLFNVVSVNPFPLGRIDVDHIWYKSTEGGSWAILPTFPRKYDGEGAIVADPVRDADHLQYVVSPIKASEFQIKLTQRNWVEEDNQKVFHMGLQEFGVKYVEFLGKSSTYDPSLENTKHVIYKVRAPEGTDFKDLSKISISPDPKKEGTGKDGNHVVYTISTEPSISSGVLWSSYMDPVPYPGVSDPISLADISEYYVIVQMRYVHEVVSSSPYLPKTSPILDHVSLSHTLIPVVTGEATPPQIDWTARNASQHFNNQITMDVLKETADDGSNMLLFWDDFWDDGTWRSGIVTDNLIIDPERMSLMTGVDTGGVASNGTLTYSAIPSAGNWGDVGNYDWIPARIWLQHTASVPSGSTLKYYLNYSTSGGTQAPVELTPGQWTTFPTVGGQVQKMWISIEMENTFGGGSSGRPRAYQLAVLVKD